MGNNSHIGDSLIWGERRLWNYVHNEISCCSYLYSTQSLGFYPLVQLGSDVVDLFSPIETSINLAIRKNI